MNKLIHTLQMALVALLVGIVSACTPDSYDLVCLYARFIRFGSSGCGF